MAELVQQPLVMEGIGWADYGLVDSGHGRKLERYGRYSIVRPEAQALWTPRRKASEWDGADAVFMGAGDEDSDGRWRYKKPLGETWPMDYEGVRFLGRFTAFRHVGVFPEQATHWDWMAAAIARAGRPVKVLNLFGYTGVASLIAARAGAEVTHVLQEPPPGWTGETGLLGRDLVARLCADAAQKGWVFVLCGPPPMMREVRAGLATLRVPSARILEERFVYD